MKIIRLESDTVILPFDCGNDDLNGFLFDNAKTHCEELIATTFLIQDETNTIAYWSYLNDKIGVSDVGSNESFFKRFSLSVGKDIKRNNYIKLSCCKNRTSCCQ